MKQRIISAFFGVIVFIAVLLCNETVFNVALVLVMGMAIFEITNAVGLKNHKLMTVASLIYPVIVVFLNDITAKFALLVYLLLLLVIMLFDRDKYSFVDACMFFTATVLISHAFVYTSFVREMEYGVLNLLIIFIGCWITDTCAYFTGVFIGKHKLAPVISPKKTIEGSIGGIVGVSVILATYTYIASNIMGIDGNVARAAVIGVICGVISQFGDLCASIIKREHNIKDFGNLMPGHGGVMDRFDSMIFVAPVVYYFITYFPIFG